MSDSPTLSATDPSIIKESEGTRPKPPPILPSDLQKYIIAFWTSLPPLIDHGSSIAQTPSNRPNHYDEAELEKFYKAFMIDCRGKRSHTADTFEDTLKRTKCYPWEVKQHDSGYAWYVALALAALEVEEFSGGKDESVSDRLPNAKKKVSEAVRSQDMYLYLAFEHAKGVALQKHPVEK
jgi:hypothetical protein